MIPLELELKNFLAYQSPPPLNFEGVHVACLAGENGAGKSSLLDAITWALWGRARSNSPDDLIHQGRTEMRVALTFAQGTDRYQVIRQRKAGKRGTSILEFQIWSPETESWRSLSESTIRDTQNRIDELLRLDYETFTNSAFLVQGQADAFTTKTPTQRKQRKLRSSSKRY
ncbi:MAG: AAA family ATPase, partial [Anaerolineales bacterium]